MARLSSSTAKWMLLFLFFVGFSIHIHTGTCLARESNASKLYKQGINAYRQGKTKEAIDLFKTSADSDPTFAHPLFSLARIYDGIFTRNKHSYLEAVYYHERLADLLEANPPKPPQKGLYKTYLSQGMLYLKGGDYLNALNAFDTYLTVADARFNSDEIHNGRGIALYYLDQYDEAVEAFREALYFNADYAEARFNLRSVFTRLATYNEAAALARAGEPEVALQKLEGLKELAPRYLPGRQLEARIHKSFGNDTAALNIFIDMLEIKKDHPINCETRLEMAKILAAKGETKESCRLLRENIKLYPQFKDMRLMENVKKSLTEFSAAVGSAK